MKFIYILLFGVLSSHLMATDERKVWKNQAIQEITKQVKESKEPKLEGSWISSNWIICKNGDWVAYRSVDGSHPDHDKSVSFRDIFICYTSENEWYYSTYHFCIDMYAFKRMDGQPSSLKEFIDKCWLAPFDGESDEALKSTRPLTKGAIQSGDGQ